MWRGQAASAPQGRAGQRFPPVSRPDFFRYYFLVLSSGPMFCLFDQAVEISCTFSLLAVYRPAGRRCPVGCPDDPGDSCTRAFC
jgi:hypothetical protein